MLHSTAVFSKYLEVKSRLKTITIELQSFNNIATLWEKTYLRYKKYLFSIGAD